MQLDLQPGPGLVAPLTWVAAMLMARQLAVSAMRPLVLWEPLPSVRVMALLPSAAVRAFDQSISSGAASGSAATGV